MTDPYVNRSALLSISDQNNGYDDSDEQSDIAVIRVLLASHLIDGKATSLYQLVKWLQQPEQAIFNSDALKDSLLLFRCNFLIMHCLYQLRIQWLSEGTGELEISALSIGLKPLRPSEQRLPDDSGSSEQNHHNHQNHQDRPTQPLDHADPLQAYYLDLSNLSTSREQIEQLLQQFWKRMSHPDYSRYQDDDLALLELSPPVSAADIRQQYRRLAMQHHPDRGGDSVRFRQISAAFQRLKQTGYYR